MYALIMYDHHNEEGIGAELYETLEQATKQLRQYVMTDTWVQLSEQENIERIDKIAAERDMDLLDDYELCEDLGIEVGERWTWARLFDGGYGVTEYYWAVQYVELIKENTK